MILLYFIIFIISLNLIMYSSKMTINVSDIFVIQPLGSDSFTDVTSGEKGGVNIYTKINIKTSNAFPTHPIYRAYY